MLVGVSLGTLTCFQPIGVMWPYDNWHEPRTQSWLFGVTWTICVIVSGTSLMVPGTYGAVVETIKGYRASRGLAAFRSAELELSEWSALIRHRNIGPYIVTELELSRSVTRKLYNRTSLSMRRNIRM